MITSIRKLLSLQKVKNNKLINKIIANELINLKSGTT